MRGGKREGAGRPAKEVKKDIGVYFLLNSEEYKILENLCKAAGMTKAAYIRKKIFKSSGSI